MIGSFMAHATSFAEMDGRIVGQLLTLYDGERVLTIKYDRKL